MSVTVKSYGTTSIGLLLREKGDHGVVDEVIRSRL